MFTKQKREKRETPPQSSLFYLLIVQNEHIIDINIMRIDTQI